ncbi:unnamed protein product [Sphagnum troendelagicum]|uniref:FAS1 domain-containing protein n=1 Tax=Sphagnum troendelagicum TaxID=128251 RepID=A0ABP0UHX4_9BRYO
MQNCGTITLFKAVAKDPNLSRWPHVWEPAWECHRVCTQQPGLQWRQWLFHSTVCLRHQLERVCLRHQLERHSCTCSGNNKAASILLYHIVSSPYVASELLDAADAHMLLQTELSGYNLTVSTSTGSIEIIGGASSGTVVQSNVKVCDSAVVHIINAVLLPSSPLTTIPSQPSHNEPDIGAGLDPAISSTLLLGLVVTAATSVLLL